MMSYEFDSDNSTALAVEQDQIQSVIANAVTCPDEDRESNLIRFENMSYSGKRNAVRLLRTRSSSSQ
jgi:hypothetical protein